MRGSRVRVTQAAPQKSFLSKHFRGVLRDPHFALGKLGSTGETPEWCGHCREPPVAAAFPAIAAAVFGGGCAAGAVCAARLEQACGVTEVSIEAADNLVDRMAALGILVEVTGQARNRMFQHAPYVRLFEDA